MISSDKKFIFIHIPKTAGTSVEKHLGHFSVLERGSQDHRTIREIQSIGLSDSWSVLTKEGPTQLIREIRGSFRYRERINKRDMQHYYKFAFVRNPWARVYSWYRNVIRDEIHLTNRGIPANCDFYRFLTEFGWQTELRSQLAWITDRYGQVCMDFIGRFESLDKDMEKICEQLSLPFEKLPHLINSSNDDYHESYDERTRKLVTDRYADEISFFGYKFEDGI